jgi:YidC/Oxa1 family membrane protein insertase
MGGPPIAIGNTAAKSTDRNVHRTMANAVPRVSNAFDCHIGKEIEVEKRFVIFLVGSSLIMLAWLNWNARFAPKPPPKDQENVAENDKDADDGEQPDIGPGDEPEAPDEIPIPAGDDTPLSERQQWLSLGSIDAEGPYRLLVTLTSKGAAVERAEITSPRYRSIETRSGYLGYLSPTETENAAGVVVNVVGAGTPASLAGLKMGDVVREMDDTPIQKLVEYEQFLDETEPGQNISITVHRKTGDKPEILELSATLAQTPMQIIKPEFKAEKDKAQPLRPTNPREQHPLSFLTTLQQVGGKSIVVGEEEIDGIASLRDGVWEIVPSESPDEVVFRMILSKDLKQQVGDPLAGSLEVTKRFRIEPVPAAETDNTIFRGYHLNYAISIRNLTQKPLDVAYRQDGPTGLPTEGWWYQVKTHTKMFKGAGVRDIIWQEDGGGFTLIGCPAIASKYRKDDKNPTTPIVGQDTTKPMRFAGVDTLYFSAVMMPHPEEDMEKFVYSSASARPVAGVNPNFDNLTDVSFRLVSVSRELAPEEEFSTEYVIFLGPKEPDLLAQYELEGTIVYGWFWFVAKPMISILHLFHDYMVFNYGLAIIMLTVLVRGCMFPLSRKQALSARKMQELQPEIKRIAETYKNDMEKRTKAQQDLFRKHNYNPLGGCVLVFFQLPVFIGLYRGLSIDIFLRDQAFIPGLQWCSNLAAPDQLWFWQPLLPTFLSGPKSLPGPYLNLLPLITIVLFYTQTKLFTPPAADEQQAMQQKIMSFMMLFIGLLFFKVAAGLCVYFIASSLWGITERKLLPKAQKPEDANNAPATEPPVKRKTPKKPKSKKKKR